MLLVICASLFRREFNDFYFNREFFTSPELWHLHFKVLPF